MRRKFQGSQLHQTMIFVDVFWVGGVGFFYTYEKILHRLPQNPFFLWLFFSFKKKKKKINQMNNNNKTSLHQKKDKTKIKQKEKPIRKVIVSVAPGKII